MFLQKTCKVKSNLDHINEMQALAEMQRDKAIEIIAECERQRKGMNLEPQNDLDALATKASLDRQRRINNKHYQA